jgi:hypothetical protein
MKAPPNQQRSIQDPTYRSIMILLGGKGEIKAPSIQLRPKSSTNH